MLLRYTGWYRRNSQKRNNLYNGNTANTNANACLILRPGNHAHALKNLQYNDRCHIDNGCKYHQQHL